MPRRRRGWIDNACYHITHRCHEQAFLFKFKKYRDMYLKQLFETKKRFKIYFLDYMITSNHVHLLVTARKGEGISEALQYLNGTVAQSYNRMREREGAFWADRFSSTLIQNGTHLRRCLLYIDLNMVRAGKVKHPAEWKHCGYNELFGGRERYRIINEKRLLKCLAIENMDELKKWHDKNLNEKLKKEDLKRESCWSQSVAIGDPEWLIASAKTSGLKRYKIDKNAYIHFLTGKNHFKD